VLSPLGFVTRLLVEVVLAGGGHPGVVSAPAGTLRLEEVVCKICDVCSRDKESLC